MHIKDFIPAASWLPNYNKTLLKSDLFAGLTVGIMLIPQGMAYAMLAGLPPIYGLYASIVPLIVYAILGTSRQLAIGPVAMVSLLIAAGVGTMAEAGTEAYVQLAIVLALMVGVIQLGMGVFRLGFLVNFLSHPVISGFTSAAALIIGFNQLKYLLGYAIPRSNHVHEIIINAFQGVAGLDWATLLIGLASIFIIVLIKRINSPVPGPLVAVVFGILVVYFMRLDVAIVGEIPKGLPAFQLSSFSWEQIQTLLPIALTISFIGFMESIAVAKAIQAKHRDYKVVPNQELIALGAANIAGSFFQAFPTTGGFSRTAVNDQSGAKTGMASIFSAILIVITLLFLTPIFYFLPKAILAAIIIVAVTGLFDYKEMLTLWKSHRGDFWMLIVTFMATLFLGIEEGILIGVVLSLGMVIYQTTQPHIAELGKIPGKPHYRNLDRFEQLEGREDILIIRFDALLYFANVNFFMEEIESAILRKGDKLKLFILDADSMNSIDSSGMHAIEAIEDLCKTKGIGFNIAGLKGPVRDAFQRSGIYDKMGKENFFFKIQHAVESYDKKQNNQYEEYTLQTNVD